MAKQVIDPRQIAAVKRNIERAGERFVGAGRDAMQRAGRRIQVGALERVPVDEGDLRASARLETDDDGTLVAFGAPPSELWYAQVAHQPGEKAAQWFDDAVDEELETWPGALAEDIKRKL